MGTPVAEVSALYTSGVPIRKYDPSQPRVPAGTPTGGRWTATGGAWSITSDKNAWADHALGGEFMESYKESVGEAADEMHHALTAAGVPIYPIEIVAHPADLDNNHSTVGWYNTDDPGRLHLDARSDHSLSFFGIHEYGHMLDVELWGSAGKFASTSGRSPLAKVMAAIKSSSWATVWKGIDNGAYWGSDTEMFARALSQYVTHKSGSESMQSGLREQADVHWPLPEFAPIGEAFNELFASFQKRYNPSQPRVPAGNSDGGQWTSAGSYVHPTRNEYGTVDYGMIGGDPNQMVHERVKEAVSGEKGRYEKAGVYEIDDRPFESSASRAHSARQARAIADGELAAIESVIGNLPDGPIFSVRMDERMREGLYASFNPKNRSFLLNIDKVLPGNFTHEYGHYLDHVVFGKGLDFASGKTNGILGRVMGAIFSSPTFKGIETTSHTDHKKSYMTTPTEAFARAFTQWIGERSGDSNIREHIADWNADENWSHYQWPDEEFVPIAAAFDDLFKIS